MFKLATIPLILAAFFVAPGSHAARRANDFRPVMILSPRVLDELSLTDDQETKIKTLKDNHIDKMLDSRQKMERMRLELARLMDDDEPSQSKIEAKIREIGSLKTGMQLERTNFYFQVRKSLTKEQIDKLGSIRPVGRNDEGRHRASAPRRGQ